MKKNEVKTVDQKNLLIASIDKDLSDFVSGKIKGITLTLGLVNKLTRLNKIGGFDLSSFLRDKIINSNDLKNIDWKVTPDGVTHNDRLRLFLNLVIIPALKYTTDDLKKNDPFRFEALRDITESVIASVIHNFIAYDSEGSCFTDPAGNQPAQLNIIRSKLTLFKSVEEAKARYNSKGLNPFPLSFEKLKSFSNELLLGRSSRVVNNDPTISKTNEKLQDIKKEIASNISFTQVDPKATEAVKKLSEVKKNNEVDETFLLVTSIIDKLLNEAEFTTVQKIALYIATKKNFVDFQRTNYSSSLEFIYNVGNQPQKIDIKDIDLKEATDKLIAVTLKEKKVINK
tara:strand:+ start:192 stop:1217 length:1026 start_codon:yes stop_codon:yes gene_type:complete